MHLSVPQGQTPLKHATGPDTENGGRSVRGLVCHLRRWFSNFDAAVPVLITTLQGAALTLVFCLPELLSARRPLDDTDFALLGFGLFCFAGVTVWLFFLPELLFRRDGIFFEGSHRMHLAVLTKPLERCGKDKRSVVNAC